MSHIEVDVMCLLDLEPGRKEDLELDIFRVRTLVA